MTIAHERASVTTGSADEPRRVARRSSLVLLLIALAATAAVRIAAARYSLWFDELASLFFASKPPSRLWSAWMLRETNPPLFYWLLHGWIGLVGLGEIRLRLPTIAASLAAMIVIHRGMTRSYGPRAAMAAILLLASSGQQLYFSHQIRAYMVLYLAVAISFCGLLRLAAPREKQGVGPVGGWAAYAGGAIAGAYCHTTAVFWPAAASLALLTLDRRFRPGGEAWRALLLADLTIVIGGAWWLGMTWLQLRSPNGDTAWMHGLGLGKATLVFAATLLQSRQIGPLQVGGPLLVAVLAASGAVRTWRDERTRLTVLLLVWATALFLLVNLRVPVVLDRTIFWLSLFSLTLAAVGLGGIGDRKIFFGAAAGLFALQSINLAVLVPRLQREDWRAMVGTAAAAPGAVLLVDGEATSVAAGLACAVELRRPCPFPIVTLVAAGPRLDTWAEGFAAPAAATAGGHLRLAEGARIYLLRRQFHDALADLHAAGLGGALAPPPVTTPILTGPLAPDLTAALAHRSLVQAGLVRLDEPAPAISARPRP